MDWIFFALTAPVIWAVINVIEKIFVNRYIKNPYVYTAIISIILGIGGLLIIPFNGLKMPSLFVFSLAIAGGLFYAYACIPYYKALEFEEVSRIVALWRFVPLFTLILAFIFLDERLNFYSYLSFFFLLTGGFLVSVRKIKHAFKLSKAFWLMILSSLLFAMGLLLTKYVVSIYPFWDTNVLLRVGNLIGGLTLLINKKTRKEFTATVSSLNLKIKSILVGNEALNLAAIFASNYAIMIGSVSLVTALSSTQPLFVLIFAIIMSVYIPKLLKEELTKKVLLQKIIAILLMIAGVVFLYL